MNAAASANAASNDAAQSNDTSDDQTSISISGELPAGAYAVGWPVDLGDKLTEDLGDGIQVEQDVLGAYGIALYDQTGNPIESTEEPLTVSINSSKLASKLENSENAQLSPLTSDGGVDTGSSFRASAKGNTLSYSTNKVSGVALLYNKVFYTPHLKVTFTSADEPTAFNWAYIQYLVGLQALLYANVKCPEGLKAREGYYFYPGGAEIAARVEIMSLPEDGEFHIYEIIDTNGNIDETPALENAQVGDSVEFTCDGYGFALVESGVASEAQTLIAEDEGDTYRVTVSYDAETGIPTAGIKLVVREMTEEADGDAYYDCYDRAYDALNGSMDDGRLFDIKIVDEGDETIEYQPAEGTFVDVLIELLNANYRAGNEAHVVHLGDEPEVLDVDVTRDGDNYTYAFAAGGFSPYAVAYTVDFYYNDYSFSINGGSEIMVSEVLKKLGLSKLEMADVQDVRFSNENLVAVVREGDDWKLISIAPFESVEVLTVEIAETSIEIKVTDAQANFNVKTANKGTQEFATLKEAVDFANTDNANNASDTSATTIKMLNDYTLTSADKDAVIMAARHKVIF